MADRALHSVLGHEPICFRTDNPLNVIGQKIFEIHTKHRFSLPAAFSFSSLVRFCLPAPVTAVFSYYKLLCLTHRNHFHSPENLCQLDAPAIDARLHCSLRNLQQIDNLLVTELFDISQYHASPEVG